MRVNRVRRRTDLLGRTTALACDCGYVYWKPRGAKDRFKCDACKGVRRKPARITPDRALAEVITAIYPGSRSRFLRKKYSKQRRLVV